MKSYLLISVFVLTAAVANFGQTPAPTPNPAAVPNTTPIAEPVETMTEDGVNVTADQIRQLPVGPASAAGNPYVRPDAKARQKRYIKSVVGPFALARNVATAGYSTWRNSPREWGDRWEGFGRRVASNFGSNVIKQTTIYGLDEAFRYDSKFYRSKNKSVGARVRNALISPVTARDRSGKRVVGVPRLVGTYTSTIASRELWYPARYGWKDGVKSGTISLGFNAAFNLFKEFVWKK